MSEDKSDTHGNHSFVNDDRELSEVLKEKYLLEEPLQQMSVLEFLRTAIWHDWNKELTLRRGNSNTACPTHLILPNGILEIALVNNCVGFGLSPFYGTQKVVVYDYLM